MTEYHFVKLNKDFDTSNHFQAMVAMKVDNADFCADVRIVDVDMNKAYAFQMDRQLLDKLEQNVRKDVTHWAKSALVGESLGEFSFSFPEADSRHLIWRKKAKGSLLLKVGEIPVTSVDVADTQRAIFDRLVSEKRNAADKLADMQLRFDRIVDEKKAYQIRIEEMIADKKSLETDMYSSFLPILHTKQKRIKELEDEIAGKSDVTRHEISSSDDDNADINA